MDLFPNVAPSRSPSKSPGQGGVAFGAAEFADSDGNRLALISKA
jgi:hypothetical protein